MDGYREKKQPVVFFIVLFAAALYGGYCLGPLSEKDLDLLTLRQDIEHALLHPLPFHFGSGTILGIGIAMVLWLLFFLTVLSNDKKYMFGKEYGSARLADPKELNEVLEDKDPRKNKILSEHLRMSMQSYYTKRNNNVVIIGGSGFGSLAVPVSSSLAAVSAASFASSVVSVATSSWFSLSASQAAVC